MSRKKFALKRILSTFLVGTVLTGTYHLGRTSSNYKLSDLATQIENLEKLNNDLEGNNEKLSTVNSELEEKIKELNTINSVLEEQNKKLQTEVQILQPQELNKVNQQKAISLFYKDGILNVDSLSDPFKITVFGKSYISHDWAGQPLDNFAYNYIEYDKLFREIKKDGVKYLVDVNDFSMVDLSNYQNIFYGFYYPYYDQNLGGKDNKSDFSGYVLVVETAKNTFSLYDLESFDLIISNCYFYHDYNETFGKDYYSTRVFDINYAGNYIVEHYGHANDNRLLLHPKLKSKIHYISIYDAKNGGTDEKNTGSGYVTEFIKDGINYLVDANDFTKILAYNYEEVSWDDYGIIAITYKDGVIEKYTSDAFKAIENDILTR